MKPLFVKKNGTVSKVSGIIMNLIPSYTLAEYNALTHKPLLWVRTDIDYAQIPSEDVSYGSGSVKDALDNKVNKSGDTMSGDLKVKRSTSANSVLELGNADTNSYGLLTLYDGATGYRANLYAANLSASRSVVFPNKSGTLLVDSDVQIIKVSSGSSNNAVVTVPSTPYGTFEIVSPVMVYVGFNNSSGAVSQVKGMDGTTLTISGNNVTVPVGSYYRTAVLKFYGTGN